jgi:hypothetical protein
MKVSASALTQSLRFSKDLKWVRMAPLFTR